jgi:anti-sigma factor RsiW
MRKTLHPSNSLLVRYIDGELTNEELFEVRAHLACCAECAERQGAFVSVSEKIDASLRALDCDATPANRAALIAKLEAGVPVCGPRRAWRALRWGMAIAAMLLAALLLEPVTKTIWHRNVLSASGESSALSAASAFNVNGENFIALPYSNPDLPLNASRIVEMQIPASALAEAGVPLAPAWSANRDSMVAANVLLGIDGQPLGIDVLGAE